MGSYLGSPVVPFYPFSFGVPLLKPNSRKKGTLIIKGLLGNLVISRVIGRITIVITHIRGLITPLITTHEP